MPLVTVCLPVSSDPSAALAAIESVLAQSLTDLELLVVDDAGTGRTGEMVADLAREDERIVFWRNEEKLGTIATFNECLMRAGGTYIKLMLPGERLDPEILSLSVAVLERNAEVALVSAAQTFTGADGNPVAAPRTFVSPLRYFPANCTIPGLAAVRSMLYPTIDLCGSPSAVLFRADCIGSGLDHDFEHLAFIDYWSRVLIEGHYCFIDSPLLTVPAVDEHADFERTSFVSRSLEFLRLSDKWSPVLAEFQISRQDFLDAALMPIAEKVGELHKHGLSQQAQSRQRSRTSARISALYSQGDDEALEFLGSELLQTQELCLETLRILGFSKYMPGQGTTDEKRIYLLEQQLRELLLSPSWTKTKPLRDFKQAMVGAPDDGADLRLLRDSELVGTAEFNKAYIKYLRRQIGRIKSSLSWRISGPMRALEAKPVRHRVAAGASKKQSR